MALKHIIKHTDTEIVFKCYILENNGGTIDLSLQNDMTLPTQVYNVPTSIPDETDGNYITNYNGSYVGVTGLWWGLKKDKQLDITRIITTSPLVTHGHYYLTGAGFYDYKYNGTFDDHVYANKDIRLVFDGPGHCIVRLRKYGWISKIDDGLSIYDDPTQPGI